MYTSINEFFFSDHYLYDSDNRFNLRIKNAKIMNKLQDPQKGDSRLKKALYYYALEMLDKTTIAMNPMGMVFGNIYFRENKKIIAADLEVYKGRGNVFVAIIKDQTVVTLLIYPIAYTNQQILDAVYKHKTTTLKQLRDMDLKELSPEDTRRKTIIIDLDISDEEFFKLYPTPVLRNNSINKASGLSSLELKEITDGPIVVKEEQRSFSMKAISAEIKKTIKPKEFVIYEGMEIFVSYPDGPKLKKIRKLIIDETGSSRKYSLEFENTAKPLDLKIGDQFIISPKIGNETFKNLLDAFELPENSELEFKGPITKFNFYPIKKTKTINKLGVIIDPRQYF